MWKLADEANSQSKAENADLLKEKLEALAGKVPGLLDIEVGIDFLASEQSADVVLYTELENREALQTYQQHPKHQAVIPFVQSIAISRTVIDYDC